MPPARHAMVGITLSSLLLADATPAARAQAGWADEPIDPASGRPCMQVMVQTCQRPLDGGQTCVNVRNACPFNIEVTLCFDARRCGMQTVSAGDEWRWSGNGAPLVSSAAR